MGGVWDAVTERTNRPQGPPGGGLEHHAHLCTHAPTHANTQCDKNTHAPPGKREGAGTREDSGAVRGFPSEFGVKRGTVDVVYRGFCGVTDCCRRYWREEWSHTCSPGKWTCLLGTGGGPQTCAGGSAPSTADTRSSRGGRAGPRSPTWASASPISWFCEALGSSGSSRGTKRPTTGTSSLGPSWGHRAW